MNELPIGKLPAGLLDEMLRRYATADERVIVGARVGEDAAILDMGDRYLVAKTDPITFATDQIGWYAVHVNANDVACCGATPRWFLATILLPQGSATPELAERLFAQISGACRQLGVSFCGGHTEITHALDRPIVVGQMLGEVAPDQYVTTSGAHVGDALILTKGFAIEGTAILAKEKAEALRSLAPEMDLARLADWLHWPGISVLRDAQIALQVGGVTALHDPTEGGLATGLHELAQASGVGLAIEEPRLPLLAECGLLCRHFGLDPLGLIASGSLLIASAKDRAESIVAELLRAGISAAVIGEVVPSEQGRVLRGPGPAERPLPVFPRDEIARLFDEGR